MAKEKFKLLILNLLKINEYKRFIIYNILNNF